MKQVLIVFIGGGLGTVMRFLISKILPYSGKGFPWSTFSANMIGCLIIGIITGYFLRNISENQSEWILFATVGFCGGFTTFSTYAFENLNLLKSGDHLTLKDLNIKPSDIEKEMEKWLWRYRSGGGFAKAS